MHHRLFAILSLISALVFLTAVVFWVRSCWIVDMVDVAVDWNKAQSLRGDAIGIESWNGHAEVTLDYQAPGNPRLWADGLPVKPGTLSYEHLALMNFSWIERWPTSKWAGFYSASDVMFVGSGILDINHPDSVKKHYGAPYWFILAITGFCPAFWLVGAMRRGKRTRQGLCARCGYDIRASSNRCPECGTAVATA